LKYARAPAPVRGHPEGSAMLRKLAVLTTTVALLGAIGLTAAPAGAGLTLDEEVVAITRDGQIFSFSSTDASDIRLFGPVVDLAMGEKILGIDFRPANGRLYAVTNGNRIYTLEPEEFFVDADLVSTIDVPLAGKDFGVDFNPVVDRMRIVSAQSGQSLAVNVETGVATVNGSAFYAVAGDAAIVGSAYTNNFAGAATTVLYGLDQGNDSLVTQNTTSGQLTIVGDSGRDIRRFVGFDISSEETAIAVVQNRVSAGIVVTVDLTSGETTKVGKIPFFTRIRGISAASGAM
jgi:hypothetical protein